jgi:acetamidase/formamidase
VLDGCSRGGRRWERLQDGLVERAANLDRLTHHDVVDQERLDGLLGARRSARADREPRRGSLAYTTLAPRPGGGRAARPRWPPAMGGGAEPPVFEPAPVGRVHTLPSIVGETVELGLFDPRRPPVLAVDSGDVVVYPNTLTHFLGGVQWGTPIAEIAQLRRDHPGRGPMTLIGPVAVRGAEPGDVLELRLLRCDPVEFGFNFNNPGDLGTGALPDEFPEGQVRYFELDRETMTTQWGPHIRLPLSPFQGTLGVCPDVVEPVSAVPPGPHAGNLDLRELVEGTRLFVPVWKAGGLVYTGDTHVAQGDGEVNLTAIESAMRELRLQIILHKQVPLRWPGVETPTHWLTLGVHADLNEAFRLCLHNMLAFLVRCVGLTPLDAYGLSSVAVSFRITQVVDIAQGVHAMLPKEIFAPALRQQIHPLRADGMGRLGAGA